MTAGASASGAAWKMLAVISLAQFLGMTLWFSATAVTPLLVDEFSISPTHAAWLTMAVQAGFVAGTLVTAAGRPKKELVTLTGAIREVIADAIAAGGSTLRDHIRADGSLGYFQHSFSVYDREKEACRTPGCTGTIGRIVQGGRSTFYCAACQK